MENITSTGYCIYTIVRFPLTSFSAQHMERPTIPPRLCTILLVKLRLNTNFNSKTCTLGTNISVFGTIPRASSEAKVTLEFSIDNDNSTQIKVPSTDAAIYLHQFYTSPILRQGEHTLTVIAAYLSPNSTFWFDYLAYTTNVSASEDVALSSELSMIPLPMAAPPPSPPLPPPPPPALIKDPHLSQNMPTDAAPQPTHSWATENKIITTVLTPVSVALAAALGVLFYYTRKQARARARHTHSPVVAPFVVRRKHA